MRVTREAVWRQTVTGFNDMASGSVKGLNVGLVGSPNAGTNGESGTRRFGVFEVDLHAAELRRNGLKVKLQEQPFQILTLLLERPGEVVTREDLRNRLWPADTFVDFDHSLNAAVKRLRDALGDTAENPRFIGTVARRGYRFLAPVSTNGNGAAAVGAVGTEFVRPGFRFRGWWIFVAACAVILVLLGLKIGMSLSQGHGLQVRISRLTANPFDDRVRAAAISRDGRYLAFSDETGFYLRQIDSGETHSLALPPGAKAGSISWFPDRAHLVVTLSTPDLASSLWEVSALGGNARRLIDGGMSPAVSPDGKEIVFIAGQKIRQQVWRMDADGAQPRKLVGEPGDVFGALAWSPDGTRLAYTRGRFSYDYGVKGVIEVLELHGQPASHLPVHVGSWMYAGLDGPLTWAADGHLIYTRNEPPPRLQDSNLWSVAIDRKGQISGAATRLTSDAGTVFSVSTSEDGKRLAYLKGIPQPDVYVSRLGARGDISEPRRLTLDDRQDFPFDWTPDNKDVLFVSDRTGVFCIYKQAINEMVPELLVGRKEPVLQPRLSPDGTQLLYVIYPDWAENGSSIPLMRVPLAGGTPQQILQDNWISNQQCARAPATTCLYSVIREGEITVFSFDPYKGKGEQVFQIKDELPQLYNWSLSPDGTTLAIAKGKWADEQPRIHLFPLHGGDEKWLTVQGWPGIASLDWAADSKSLWAASIGEEENALLNIDLQGRARSVWRPKKLQVGWAIPSRDGRYLALHVRSGGANAWMLERQ